MYAVVSGHNSYTIRHMDLKQSDIWTYSNQTYGLIVIIHMDL